VQGWFNSKGKGWGLLPIDEVKDRTLKFKFVFEFQASYRKVSRSVQTGDETA